MDGWMALNWHHTPASISWMAGLLLFLPLPPLQPPIDFVGYWLWKQGGKTQVTEKTKQNKTVDKLAISHTPKIHSILFF